MCFSRIVPYINTKSTGSVSGIVGAGGNVGAVAFSLCFRQLPFKSAFLVMGFTIIGSSFLSVFVRIEGHNGLLFPPVGTAKPCCEGAGDEENNESNNTQLQDDSSSSDVSQQNV